MQVLLDTCALIWAVSEPGRLSARAGSLLSAEDTEVHVSPISCAEVACASERGRIELDRHWRGWFRHSVDIGLSIIEEAYSLPEPFHCDPADRIIVATARRLDCPIVTADRKILDYPHVQTLW